MAVKVTVGDDRGIAIPTEMMQQVGIGPGSVLRVEVRDGHLHLMPDPIVWIERTRGLHREVWEGIDAQEYVREERVTCTEPD